MCSYYEGLRYYTSKEAIAGVSDSLTHVRYNWVDVCAYREGSLKLYLECEARFSMKRFREKSTRLHGVRDGVRLALVVPDIICRNHGWIWWLKGFYDQVMVYDEEKDGITKIHYLHKTHG